MRHAAEPKAPKKNTKKGNERKADLAELHFAMVYPRFKERRKKANHRIAHNANGNIRHLDRTVEQNPMNGQQSAASGNLEELSPSYLWQTCKNYKDEQGNQNAIKHDIHLIHGNEASKHSRKSR